MLAGMGTTRGVLSYILVTIPGGGTLHARACLFFRGFSTCFALQNLHNFHRLPGPSPALVPTKQSRPEHGAARILPFEIGRKILLAQTKNLLLFLHSGSNTELLLLLQSPRRGGLTDCARSLAAAALSEQHALPPGLSLTRRSVVVVVACGFSLSFLRKRFFRRRRRCQTNVASA